MGVCSAKRGLVPLELAPVPFVVDVEQEKKRKVDNEDRNAGHDIGFVVHVESLLLDLRIGDGFDPELVRLLHRYSVFIEDGFLLTCNDDFFGNV